MTEDFLKQNYKAYTKSGDCPNPAEVVAVYKAILHILFPELSEVRFESQADYVQFAQATRKQLISLMQNSPCGLQDAERFATDFFNALPAIKEVLHQDVNALYEGDPAAKSKTEVIRTYPGFVAICAHRIAHEFAKEEINLIPRIISEYAHSKTGIDIHPAATIGPGLCIDHGTGVVIGETTTIGANVKIYQGVTLGALSVRKEDAKIKRHPTIEDNVVIYAGATILGGKTSIGRNSVIGGNVWLTQSVPANSRVTYDQNQINQLIETR